MNNFEVNPFSRFKKEWALISVCVDNHVNSMTIGWGEMGCLWGKDVITVFLKPNQKTFDIIQEQKVFYVHFFDAKYKKDLKVLGSLSGYECEDKFSETSIRPVVSGQNVIFNEATQNFACKILYKDLIKVDQIEDQEIVEKYYGEKEPIHQMIVGVVF